MIAARISLKLRFRILMKRTAGLTDRKARTQKASHLQEAQLFHSDFLTARASRASNWGMLPLFLTVCSARCAAITPG
jgi:hypothetical protein